MLLMEEIPKQPPGMYKTRGKSWGKLVSRISEASTVWWVILAPTKTPLVTPTWPSWQQHNHRTTLQAQIPLMLISWKQSLQKMTRLKLQISSTCSLLSPHYFFKKPLSIFDVHLDETSQWKNMRKTHKINHSKYRLTGYNRLSSRCRTTRVDDTLIIEHGVST